MNPDEGDQFDLAASHAGGNLVHGNAGAGMAQGPGGGGGSGLYVVKPGDTLSKISETVYGQPWMWAKLWGQNPQIQNPHWIYPGDQVRLGPDSGNRLRASGASLTLGGGSRVTTPKAKPGSAIFIGEKGYLDDPAAGIAGEIIGATQPVQLMSQGDEIYISIRPGQQLTAGQVVQIFREVRDAPKVDGARTPPGKVVAVKGAVRLDYVQPEKRIARGVIVESRDIIERGDHVADVPLSFWVVPARPSSKNTVARVLTSMRPSIFLGQQDVVFIDRGSEDGLIAGNRLFVVRRGDTWRRTLDTASVQAQTRVEMDNGDGLHFEVTTPRGNEQDFPEEIIGELRIIKTQRFSSYALVTASRSELVPGDRAVARTGY